MNSPSLLFSRHHKTDLEIIQVVSMVELCGIVVAEKSKSYQFSVKVSDVSVFTVKINLMSELQTCFWIPNLKLPKSVFL